MKTAAEADMSFLNFLILLDFFETADEQCQKIS